MLQKNCDIPKKGDLSPDFGIYENHMGRKEIFRRTKKRRALDAAAFCISLYLQMKSEIHAEEFLVAAGGVDAVAFGCHGLGEEGQFETSHFFAVRFIVDGPFIEVLVVFSRGVEAGEYDEMIGDGEGGAGPIARCIASHVFAFGIEYGKARDGAAFFFDFFAVFQQNAVDVNVLRIGTDIGRFVVFIRFAYADDGVSFFGEFPVFDFHEIDDGAPGFAVFTFQIHFVDVTVLGKAAAFAVRSFRIGAGFDGRAVQIGDAVQFLPLRVFRVLGEIHIFPVGENGSRSDRIITQFLEVFGGFFFDFHLIERIGVVIFFYICGNEIQIVAFFENVAVRVCFRNVDALVFIDIGGAVAVFFRIRRRCIRFLFRRGSGVAASGNRESQACHRQCQKNFLVHVFRLQRENRNIIMYCYYNSMR